jgi:hypothetical protein
MTPQELKALLPETKVTKKINKLNENEKLYTIYDLGNHFGVSGDTIRCWIKANKIQCRDAKPSQIGFYRYYKLEDLKDYRPNRKYIVKIKNNNNKKMKQIYSELSLVQKIKLFIGLKI